MKKKTIVILTISAILLTGAAVSLTLLLSKPKGDDTDKEKDGRTRKEKKQDKETQGTVSETERAENQKKKATDNKGDELTIGMQGKRVALLQAMLNYAFGGNLRIDGKYGESTRDAVYNTLSWYEKTPKMWKFDAATIDTDEWNDIKKVVDKKGGFDEWLARNKEYQKAVNSYE